MRSFLIVAPLLVACGNTQHGPADGAGGAGNAAPSEMEAGAAGGREIVLASTSEPLPVCDAPSLQVSGTDGSDDWQKDLLLYPTSWQTFRGYAMRGPIDALTGIWSSGPGSEPFEDREVRPLSGALISANGELLCAAGAARALRNGVHAALQLSGLGSLTCSAESVPGELRYCHDCHLGSYALEGSLEGEPVLEVTGGHSRVGDTLYLQIGWGVLIAKLAPADTTETLVAGAYLSRAGQVYCFDSATGDARDLSTADVTFTGFHRAAPCQGERIESVAQACLPQFQSGKDW